jgi:hypothetical protein
MMLDGRPPSQRREEWESFAREAGFQVQNIQHTSIPTSCSILVLQKQSPRMIEEESDLPGKCASAELAWIGDALVVANLTH